MNAAAEPAVARRPAKSAAAFRTISEVAGDLDVPQHVLRFWETKFAQVRPLKRGGGRRYYRPEDVDLLRRIRKLLYSDGYTIKGVQKLLREGGLKGMRAEAEAAVARVAEVRPQAEPAAKPAAVAKPESDRRRAELKSVLAELEAVKKLLGEG